MHRICLVFILLFASHLHVKSQAWKAQIIEIDSLITLIDSVCDHRKTGFPDVGGYHYQGELVDGYSCHFLNLSRRQDLQFTPGGQGFHIEEYWDESGTFYVYLSFGPNSYSVRQYSRLDSILLEVDSGPKVKLDKEIHEILKHAQ